MMSPRQIKFMSTILNILLNVIITLCVLTMLHAEINFASFTTNFLLAFAIGCAVGDYIPALEWGIKLAGGLGFKPNSFLGYVISTVVLAFFMATFISFFSMFIGMGPDVFMNVWPNLYPIILVVVIASLLILRAIVTKITFSVCKE